MTKTEKLAGKLKKIAAAHKEEIDQLPTRGPSGGNNARTIKGWANVGNATISRAWNSAGLPAMSFWSGSLPTSSTAIPECCIDEAFSVYFKIFN